jgi:hypothetical protein
MLLFYAGEKHEPLGWDLRVDIALDVARGLEYLHDGVTPRLTCVLNDGLLSLSVHTCRCI